MKSICAKIPALSLARIAGLTLIGIWAQAGFTQDKIPENASVESLALEYDVMRANLIKPIKDLQKGYQTQLEALRDKMKSAGNLDKTLAVNDELDKFREGKTKTADGDFPELRRLQSIYLREASHRLALARRKLPDLVRYHKSRLAELQKQLTTQSKLEEAAKAKEAISNVDEALGIIIPGALERELLTGPAVVEWQGPTKPFDKGELQFANRSYVWANIPREFRGWKMSMRAGNSRLDSKIRVKTRGVVYVVLDPGAEKAFEKDGWKIIERLLGGRGGKQEYKLAEKAFNPGEYTIPGEGFFMTTRILLPPSP